MTKFFMEDTYNISNLSASIIEQAVKDYREALTKLKTGKGRMRIHEAERFVEDCESFFKSEWFDLMTKTCGDISGDAIIETIQKQVEEQSFKQYPKKRMASTLW